MTSFSHGIIAVSPQGEIVHFVGYIRPPVAADFVALQIELDEDPEFGLVEKRGEYKLIEAPERIVKEYLQICDPDMG